MCLWCCFQSKFVVQRNSFLSFVLFSSLIHNRRGKKLIIKTIKHKLNNSLKIQIAFFSLKTFIFFVSWKTIDFVENLEMTQIAGDGGSCSLRRYDAVRRKIDM